MKDAPTASRVRFPSLLVLPTLVALLVPAALWAGPSEPSSEDPVAVAARVDRIIEASLAKEKVELASPISDEQFLRRISYDLAGAPPSVNDVLLFVLDGDSSKRARKTRDLVQNDDFARRWARYWRDAIAYRSQDRRFQIVRRPLEDWLAEQFAAQRGWDGIVSDLITSTGDVRGNGTTGLIMAQMGEANEIAAEVSRLFLGIQIQCAQCHDHPYDRWKREDFHKFAAFFPRISVRRKRDEDGQRYGFEVVSLDAQARALQRGSDGMMEQQQRFFDNRTQLVRRYDRNRDGKLAANELPRLQRRFFERLRRGADKDGDGMLTSEELEKMQLPSQSRRGPRGEHFMSDLENPEKRGTMIHPSFFVNQKSPGEFVRDADRRLALAGYLRAEDNPWFARAMVNRVWKEMLGRGFVEPVDDMGPDRDPVYPEALDALANGFRASGYQLAWLVETIAATRAYARQSREPSPLPDAPPFASVDASRLPADSVYAALVRALEIDTRPTARPSRRQPGQQAGQGPRRRPSSPRSAFEELFGYDPSTSTEDVAGTVPQALFLMNSPVVEKASSARGDTVLARLLRRHADDRAILDELYLRFLSRQPSEHEVAVFTEHRAGLEDRAEAFEDLLWGLANSTEFQTRR